MEGNEKFINRYRIDSTRLSGWNYGDNGYYFVTICTHNREFYFGDVLMDNAGEWSVALTSIGKIVRDELLKTPHIRPNVKLDEWVIMPNHVHAIIVIENPVETAAVRRLVKTTEQYRPVGLDETPQRGRLYNNGGRGEHHPWHKPEWQSNSLGSIVNQFKSVCTKKIRKINPSFAWQSRFYDHIIRTESALNKIRQYIKINPAKWQRDRNNPDNLWM